MGSGGGVALVPYLLQGVCGCLWYGVFPLPETDSYIETETDECTDISGKMGTVPNGIGLCTCIGLGIGSVETVLFITIEAISIYLCLGLGIGIGLGQWKRTSTRHLRGGS